MLLFFTLAPLRTQQEAYGIGSYYNDSEANLVSRAVQRLLAVGVPARMLGIIALCTKALLHLWTCGHRANARPTVRCFGELSLADKSQVERIQRKLAECLGTASAAVQVSTVDAFQGAEREIMFVSCVRTRTSANDFVDSARRINVALSRARRCAGHPRIEAWLRAWLILFGFARAHWPQAFDRHGQRRHAAAKHNMEPNLPPMPGYRR